MDTRIPPPIIVAITAILMFVASRFTGALPITVWPFAILFGAGGIALALLGASAFRAAKTTIDPMHPDQASSMVTGGIYEHTRNPMYLGMALVLLAVAVLLRSPWTLLGPLAFMAYITRFQILPEERALTQKFGDEYTIYTKRVGRWL
jgi:protein-S-isoprenylcysteine O-methyltransferase Ste14